MLLDIIRVHLKTFCLYCILILLNVHTFHAENKTVNGTISGRYIRTVPSPNYTAVNVSVVPTESFVSKVFYFKRPEILPLAPYVKRFEDFRNLSKEDFARMPPSSLWVDRFVLVVTVRQLHLPSANICPRPSWCPIPGLLASDSLRDVDDLYDLCRKYGSFSPGCDSNSAGYNILFPFATGLYTELDELGEQPQKLDIKFNFVASVAYRLSPIESECPEGMYICPPVEEEMFEVPTSPVAFSIRLCMPHSLFCDGACNCPGVQCPDESNCDHLSSNISTVAGESELMQTTMSHYSNDWVHWIGRADRKLARFPYEYILILFFLLLVAFIIVFVVCKCCCPSDSQNTPHPEIGENNQMLLDNNSENKKGDIPL